MSSLDEENPDGHYQRIGEIVSIFHRRGVWYANYQHYRKQVRRSLKTNSKKEARRRAILLEADLQSGRYQTQVKAPRIEEVIKTHISHLRTEGRSYDTIRKSELVGNRMLKLAAQRGARTILDIDLAFVDAYRSERASKADERGKTAGRRTIMNETVKIRSFVKFAFTRKMISQDPLAGLKIPKVKSHGQPCWSPLEVESILAVLEGQYHDAFVLWADTGMRFAEVAWLTWADIDLANNAILIRAKKGWKPKTGEERAIPMTMRVRTMLSERPHCFEWVFTMRPSAKYPSGDHQLQESRLLAYLQRRLERLGFRGMIHTFRHSFITNALLSGTPEAIVRQWVGHLDRDVTKIYTHVRSSDSQAAMRRLSDLMPPSTDGHTPIN